MLLACVAIRNTGNGKQRGLNPKGGKRDLSFKILATLVASMVNGKEISQMWGIIELHYKYP